MNIDDEITVITEFGVVARAKVWRVGSGPAAVITYIPQQPVEPDRPNRHAAMGTVLEAAEGKRWLRGWGADVEATLRATYNLEGDETIVVEDVTANYRRAK